MESGYILFFTHLFPKGGGYRHGHLAMVVVSLPGGLLAMQKQNFMQ
jgi:hypothetical protein